MKPVIAGLPQHPEADDHADGKPDGQTGHIDKRKQFVPSEIPVGNFQMILEQCELPEQVSHLIDLTCVIPLIAHIFAINVPDYLSRLN